MKRIVLLGLLIGLIQFVPNQAYAKPNCSTVKKQVTKLFEQPYQAEDLSGLGEFAKRVVKAYQTVFSNSSCYKKKEIAEMRVGVKELKQSCDKARKDEMAWAIQGGLCKIYTPLWKYIR